MLWEGGVRGTGFLWSPLLEKSGYVSDKMMQIMDWVPTLLSVAGYNMSSLPMTIDGYDLWHMLSVNEDDTFREEMLLNHDPILKYKGIRVKNFKLIKGTDRGYSGWYKPGQVKVNKDDLDIDNEILDPPNEEWKAEKAPASMFQSDLLDILYSIGRKVRKAEPVIVNCGPKPSNASKNCKPTKAPCLYDIEADPCEYNNLADTMPYAVEELLTRLKAYEATSVYPKNKKGDPAGYPSKHGYAWTPWVTLNQTDTV